MKPRPVAARRLLTLALVLAVWSAVAPRARCAPPEATGGQRTVAVRFGDYQRLVERRREIEEKLGREGGTRAVDVVIAKAYYEVKLGEGTAAISARFQVQTLKPGGWKLVPLVGGAVSVSRFAPPGSGAFLVVRDMLPALASSMAPGTHYLLFEGALDGELQLDFMVPALLEGHVRRLQFAPPPVPLSTLEMTVASADLVVSIDPGARVEELPVKTGEPRRIRASLRGGDLLNVVLARPEAPAAASSGAPGQPPAPPPAELVVDQLNAQWSLTDTRIRLRQRLVVDVRSGPVDRLILRKPALLANVQVREDVGSTLLEESSVGKALDPEGRQETLELKLRAPVSGRLVRLALTADLRAEPDSPELALSPITVDGARGIVEGYAAVSSQLPHAITLERAQGAHAVSADRLPMSFGPTDGPLLLVAALTAPAPVLTLTQQVLPRPKPIAGAIQKLDVTTDLSGKEVRTRYKATVSPGAEGTVVVSLPAQPGDAGWTLEDMRGTTSVEPTQRAGTFLLHLKPGDPAPLEFDVRHPGEGLRGTGDVVLQMARFNVPARNVSWTVLEPEGMRMWGWRGTFAEAAAPPDVFIQRFVTSMWGWAGQVLLGFAEPTSMFWILLVLLGLTLARSAALGRLPLDASMGQAAFLAGIVVLGAVFVHVLTNASNPGAGLTDGRGDQRRPIEEALARPPAPASHPFTAPRLPEEEGRDARRSFTDDASSAGPSRHEGTPAPQPGAAAPPPVAVPMVAAAPVIRATSVDPMSRDGSGTLGSATPSGTSAMSAPTSSGTQMSAATPVPASTPAPAAAPGTLGTPQTPEGRASFTRAAVLPGDGPGLTVEASFLERRWESIATALGMLIGVGLFLTMFLAVRQMLDVPTANVIGGVALMVLWLLDTRFPFVAPFAAAGFGLPVLLLGSVKIMGHALDTWDAWREEGERYGGRPGAESHGGSEGRSGSWSASFPRTGDRNEVPIKEIFAETPPAAAAAAVAATGGAAVAAGDEISFVSEDEDGGEAASEAQGGEPQ